MKKIILLITLLTGILFAKPCMTDIYFGNGVWNSQKDAVENRNALRKFMLYQANIRLDPQKEKVDYQFKYAHNPSHGTINDLIETYWQLRESGQISHPYFYTISSALAMTTGNFTQDEIWEKISNIVSHYNDDVITMLHLYQNASFKQKHNVLLVAHSQGNLWGNKMYTYLDEEEKKKFRMVSVATPAGYVMIPGQISPYVTVVGDLLIKQIPGALPGYVDGVGHSFVSTYLTGSINAPRKIALFVKAAYDNLMQTTSCSIYKYTKVLMPTFGTLKIMGRSTSGYFDEEIDTVSLKQKEAYWDDNENRYKCGKEDTPYTTGNGWGNNWAYSNFDGQSGRMEWLPGRIHTVSELKTRSTVKENMMMEKKCVTLSLEKDGKLFDLIKENVAP